MFYFLINTILFINHYDITTAGRRAFIIYVNIISIFGVIVFIRIECYSILIIYIMEQMSTHYSGTNEMSCQILRSLALWLIFVRMSEV